MPASQVTLGTYVLKDRNADQVGTDLVFEFHRVTYAADATMEVPTSLRTVNMVLVGPTADVSAPAANVLGCDRVITAGAVTVAATANNSDSFDVVFIGTSR